MRWLDELLMKRIIGLLIRRLLVFLSGVLVASYCFGTKVCTSFAEWLSLNEDGIVALGIALTFFVVSTVWSYFQKKNDLNHIRELERERKFYQV